MWKISLLFQRNMLNVCLGTYDTEVVKGWEMLKSRKIETIAVIAGSEHGMLSDQTIVSQSSRK